MISKKNRTIFVILAAIALFLDQLSKFLIDNSLTIFDPGLEIIGSVLRFKLVYNPHGVFGISFGNNILYYIFAIAGIIIFTYIGLSQKEKFKAAIFGIIVGGALGNLLDRLRLNHVVDFIDMGIGDLRWFTYNLADAFITVGAIILIVSEVFLKKKTA